MVKRLNQMITKMILVILFPKIMEQNLFLKSFVRIVFIFLSHIKMYILYQACYCFSSEAGKPCRQVSSLTFYKAVDAQALAPHKNHPSTPVCLITVPRCGFYTVAYNCGSTVVTVLVPTRITLHRVHYNHINGLYQPVTIKMNVARCIRSANCCSRRAKSRKSNGNSC